MQDAVFVLEMRRYAIKVGLQVRFHPRSIFGVDAVQPFLGAGTDFMILVAQHTFPSERKESFPGCQVPIPNTVSGAGKDKGIALLDFAFHRAFIGLKDRGV